MIDGLIELIRRHERKELSDEDYYSIIERLRSYEKQRKDIMEKIAKIVEQATDKLIFYDSLGMNHSLHRKLDPKLYERDRY